MPSYDGSVRIGVEIDTDPAKKELGQFAREAEESVSAANKIGSALKTGMAVAATAIGAATTAIGAFAKSAVDVGMGFDSSMSQVAATMGKTTDEISDLREFALEMGANTAFSATEAADALNYPHRAVHLRRQGLRLHRGSHRRWPLLSAGAGQ